MNIKSAAFAIVAATSGLASSAAMAVSSATVSWTGAVESLTTGGTAPDTTLSTANGGLFNIGDAVSGSVTFDTTGTTTTDNAGSGGIGLQRRYDNAITAMSITIAGSTWTATGGDMIVRDGYKAGSAADPADGVIFGGFIGVSGPSSGGATPDGIQFSLLDTDTSIMTGLLPPSLAIFETLGTTQDFDGNINFLTFTASQSVRFSISAVSAVPVPAGALLLLSGVGLCAAASRRRSAA